MTSGRLAALSLGVAVGGIAAYVALFRVAAVRSHPTIYAAAFAVAMALAVVAVVRARRWPAWVALGLTVVLLAAGSWFNFVLDRDGVVRWFSVTDNFQVRPDPGEVLRAVRAL